MIAIPTPTERERIATAVRTYQDAIAKSVADLLPRMTKRYELEGPAAAVALATALVTNAVVMCAAATGTSSGDAEKLRERIQAIIVEWLTEREADAVHD